MVEAGDDPNLVKEPFGVDCCAALPPEDLDGDLSIVLDVAGEPHSRHPPSCNLALQHITIAQGIGE
jgi:hypothetical protein